MRIVAVAFAFTAAAVSLLGPAFAAEPYTVLQDAPDRLIVELPNRLLVMAQELHAAPVPRATVSTPVPTKAPVTIAAKSTSCCSGNTGCTPNYEQIAQRAYEIWLGKGRPSGQDIENWKQAEAELTRGKLVTAA